MVVFSEQSNALALCLQSPQGLRHRGIKTLNDKRSECLDYKSGISPEPVQVHMINFAELSGQPGKHMWVYGAPLNRWSWTVGFWGHVLTHMASQVFILWFFRVLGWFFSQNSEYLIQQTPQVVVVLLTWCAQCPHSAAFRKQISQISFFRNNQEGSSTIWWANSFSIYTFICF